MTRRRKPRKVRFTTARPKYKATAVRCKARHGGVQCDWRTTLKRHPAEYIRVPKCGRCGASLTYVDARRMKKEWGDKKNRCCCYGYAFPHARGRGYCDHNPKLTAEDLRLREEGGPRRAPDDPPF